MPIITIWDFDKFDILIPAHVILIHSVKLESNYQTFTLKRVMQLQGPRIDTLKLTIIIMVKIGKSK